MSTFSQSNFWRSARDYLFISLGMAIYAFGFTAFILPEKVVIGGLAGIGSIIYYTLGVPVAISQLVLNFILLAMAYKIVGRQFVVGTVFGVIMISFWIGLFQPLFSTGFTNEPFLNIVIGGTLCGFGIGMGFIHNGSSGGTDIVAAMVSKYSNVSIGRTMLYTDMIIISSSFLIFHQIDRVVYGFVVLFFISFITDMVINTNRQAVQFLIISPKWKEIADAITHHAHRGCTVLDGTGWYTKEPVKIVLVMCRKIESVTIFRIARSVDATAFLIQSNVNGVYGKGFDRVKIKLEQNADKAASQADDVYKKAYHQAEEKL